MYESRTPYFIGGGIITALVLGFFGWLTWFNGSVAFRGFFTSGRSGVIFTFGVILIIILVIGAIIAGGYNGWVSFGLGVAAAAVLAVCIFGWVRLAYDTDHKYASDIKTTKNTTLSYDDRTPYEVADSSASQNMENTTGELQNIKHLADESDHGTWNSLVVRRGFAQGYESLQTLDAPLYGEVNRNSVNFCKFNPSAKLRLGGGLPRNNLDRAILFQVPLNVTFHQEDAYGYCKDKTPYVVVPLQQVHGIYAPTWDAYGVAVYNGKTGKINVLTDVKSIASIPGPTYPITLSQSQREGLSATGSFADHWTGRVGYEPSSDNTDIQLRLSDSDKTAYVTPLNPKGSSQSIVGTVSINSKFTGSGKRNPISLNALSNAKTLPSISAQEQLIQNSYSNLNGFANSNGGFKFFEVIPGKDGKWTASIGRNQSIIYRATIEQKGGNTVVSLYDADGNLIHGLKNVDGTDSNTGTHDGDNDSTITVPGNLDEMSTQQLQELGKQVLDELAQRAGTTADSK